MNCKAIVFHSAFIVQSSSLLFIGIGFAIIAKSIMKRHEVVLISNPNAGRGGSGRAREVARFCESLRKRGIEVEALDTRGPNDAARLAAKVSREGVRDVIVSG